VHPLSSARPVQLEGHEIPGRDSGGPIASHIEGSVDPGEHELAVDVIGNMKNMMGSHHVAESTGFIRPGSMKYLD
jgi:hypothetical protein